MVELQCFARPIRVLHDTCHGLAGRQVCEADQIEAIVLADAVVIGRILEGQGQESLFLEIRLVDARKAPGDDGSAA